MKKTYRTPKSMGMTIIKQSQPHEIVSKYTIGHTTMTTTIDYYLNLYTKRSEKLSDQKQLLSIAEGKPFSPAESPTLENKN